jgi:hypothetical protein
LSVHQLHDEPETNDPPENPDQTDNSCSCWAKIMSLQSDFVNERALLQATIEEAGHVCLFLPKFHCELNPMELFWSYFKQAYCKENFHCKMFNNHEALFERVRQSCALVTIRQYFQQID